MYVWRVATRLLFLPLCVVLNLRLHPERRWLPATMYYKSGWKRDWFSHTFHIPSLVAISTYIHSYRPPRRHASRVEARIDKFRVMMMASMTYTLLYFVWTRRPQQFPHGERGREGGPGATESLSSHGELRMPTTSFLVVIRTVYRVLPWTACFSTIA